jgi:hypothetical protein
MESLRKWSTLLLQIAIVIIIIMLYMDRKTQDEVAREYWENPNFKTDSVKAYIDYNKMPKPIYKNYVPPKIVIQYIDSTKTYDNVSIVMNDSLVNIIDSLTMQITKISIDYFKRFPNEPKLIYAEFARDSLRLDLLGIDGTLRQNTFGTNYDRFTYQLRDGEFRAEELSKKRDVKLLSSLYVNAGYDFKLAHPIIGVDYSVYMGRFRLRANSAFTLSSDTQLLFNADLGYKIR